MQDGGPLKSTAKHGAAFVGEARHDAVVVLTFTRPEARNSLSFDMLAALQSAIDRLSLNLSTFRGEVQGVAAAAGCQLVATCDLAVVGMAAKFATPGVDIGLFCSTPMVALSRNVPR